MISPVLTASVQAFQASVAASMPLGQLTPLQLAGLVAQGQALVVAIDAALGDVGTALDGDDPIGHPLVMIAAVRSRKAAVADAATLSDLRGLIGRAVLNLSKGAA